MAGGMRSGGRETLAQRVANTRARRLSEHEAPTAPPPSAAPSPHPAPAPAVKHAWYDGPHGRQPALLLRWRNVDGHYDGHICVPVPDGDGWALVEMWVDAALLAPAQPAARAPAV